ncbi:MAG: hypothetical protein ACU0DK_05225 [Pseudooceanicola sp.]
MPMDKKELEDLKKLIQKARQGPLAFGLCLGKKPEDTIFYMSLTKKPKALMLQAKQAGDTNRLTHGECSVSGKIVELHCHEDPPDGLFKRFKRFLKGNEMNMKVRVFKPGGDELEDEEADADDLNEADANDAETQEAEAETVGAQESNEADPLAAQWEGASAKLDPHVQAFANGGDQKGPAVAKAWAGAQAAAAKGDYKGAMAVLAKLAPLVRAADTPAPQAAKQADPAEAANDADPLAAKWQALSARIEPLYTRAMAANPDNRSKLQAAWAMAVEKAEAGDYKAAITVGERLAPMLESIAAAPAATPASEVPKDVVAFQKSRVLWSGTRTKMRAELGKLQAAIDAAVAGQEGVEVDTKSLADQLAPFDDALEGLLDEITQTPEGEKRDALKRKAREAVEKYQAALQGDFFADVDKNNGFADVAVTSSAVNSLAAISKVLSA